MYRLRNVNYIMEELIGSLSRQLRDSRDALECSTRVYEGPVDGGHGMMRSRAQFKLVRFELPPWESSVRRLLDGGA